VPRLIYHITPYQVAHLEKQLKEARADPLLLVREYNGCVTERSERSLSSEDAIKESAKTAHHQDLPRTVSAFQAHLTSVLSELYQQKVFCPFSLTRPLLSS
jgi:hypothetical protein